MNNFEQNSKNTSNSADVPGVAFSPTVEEVVYTKPDIIIVVTRENLEVEMQFQRTGTNTLDPEFEDVMASLATEGIIYGINEKRIRELCERPVYNRFFVVAHGLPPEVGKDGWLEFLISTKRELRPKILEDGTADFKDIGYIQQAHKGQPLCNIHLPLKGADGRDVYGGLLEGIYGKEARSPAGGNTYFSEDGLVLYAACDGNIEVRQEVVSILDVLRIQGDVDNSTGNIDFSGDVLINGDILSGFRVTTRGSIVVRGSVGGAILRADGDISIGESMNGSDRGSLRAGGNIKCKFIQSSEIYAEGNIYADTIMHCSTECAMDIELSGKKASLIGGRTTVVGRILAKQVGTSTHAATEVIVCPTGLGKDQEAAALKQNLKHLDGEITKLVQILTRFEDLRKRAPLTSDQLDSILKVKESYIHLSQQRKNTQAQLDQVKQEQLDATRNSNSYIECKGRVHTGTRIIFGPLVMQVNESFGNSRVYIKDGELTIAPIM